MEMTEETYANVEVMDDNETNSSENSYEDVNKDNLETQSARSFKQSGEF